MSDKTPNYRLRIILTAYHELKKTNYLVTQQMVADHTNIPRRTIETWLCLNRYNGKRISLDHESSIPRYMVCMYVKEHCGNKKQMTVWDLHVATKASCVTIRNMIREGELRQKFTKNSKSSAIHRGRTSFFYVNRDIKPVKLPTDFEPMTIEEYKRTQTTWNLPATFKESIRGKQTKVPRKPTAEMDENDEQDDLTISVYYALCRPSPYPEGSGQVFHGWTVAEIVKASGRCEATVRSVIKYLESGEGRLCLIKKTIVDRTAHYKQHLVSDVKNDIRLPGIRIIPGKREHEKRAA